MAENFLVVEGQLLVRDKAKGFRPVEIPEGFRDVEFRNAVATVATFWRMHGQLPSATDVHTMFPGLTAKRFGEISMQHQFAEALSYRGIDWNATVDGFSLEQQSALLMVQDPLDRRSLGVKLRELGIPTSRYQAWLKQPLFRHAVNEAAENVLTEAVAPTLVAIAAGATAGEDRKIELLLAITGRWNPAQMQLEDARAVVMSMIEAVIKHVPDPAVREAIMADVSLTAKTLAAIDQ